MPGKWRPLGGHCLVGYSIVHFSSCTHYILLFTGRREISCIADETLNIVENLLAKGILKGDTEIYTSIWLVNIAGPRMWRDPIL